MKNTAFTTTADTHPFKWRVFLALQGKQPGEVYQGTVRRAVLAWTLGALLLRSAVKGLD